MMTMRERRILAEAQDASRRIVHEGDRLQVLIADKEKTLGDLLHIRNEYAALGFVMDVEWLRDAHDNPYGVRLTGRIR